MSRRAGALTVACLVVSLLTGWHPVAAAGAAGTIDTFAGGGVGDGRPGTQTHLWALASVSADGAGRVYWVEDRFANTNTLRVRSWDPETDRVSTVAGTGLAPYPWAAHTGDGLPATRVSVSPGAVAAVPNGDFYFTHSQANRAAVHLVDGTTGLLRQVMSTGASAPSLETDKQGRLYFARGASIWRFDPVTGQETRLAGVSGSPIPPGTYWPDGRPANETPISFVNDIEVDDAGNVFFSESLRIRWIDTQGILHTLAGRPGHIATGASGQDGQYGFMVRVESGDHRLLLHPDGSVWYTEGARVRRIASEAEIPQVAGSRRVTTAFSADGGFADGPLASASFGSVVDIQEYPGGGFLVADGKNLRVRLVNGDGEVRTVVGDGRSTTYEDEEPDVYDWTGDGGRAAEAQLSAPCGVATGPDGDVYLTETEFHDKVRRIDIATGVIATVAGADRDGYEGDGGPAAEALFDGPCGVAVASDGDVFVADYNNHVVRRIDAETGIITRFAGTGTKGSSGDGGPAAAATLDGPSGLALSPDGTLYVSDPPSNRVRKVAPDGTISTIAGTGGAGYDGEGIPAAASRLNQPRGLALRADGSLLVADARNHMIRRIGPDGLIHRVAGTGQAGPPGEVPAVEATFDHPNGLVVHAPTGTIFVSDTLNQVIRRIDPDGMVRTVAGNGARGPAGAAVMEFCGDGASAAEACLNNPQYMALNGDDLLFADLSSQRVRVVFGVI